MATKKPNTRGAAQSVLKSEPVIYTCSGTIVTRGRMDVRLSDPSDKLLFFLAEAITNAKGSDEKAYEAIGAVRGELYRRFGKGEGAV